MQYFIKNFFSAFYLLVLLVFVSCNTPLSNNQQIIKPLNQTINPYSSVDKSPLDICYFPQDYPTLKMTGNNLAAPIARVIYSRPQKNGREVFGNEAPPKFIQQYGTYWRLGANESTEIEFFKPVTINGKNIPTGRYTIYCIPFEDKWVVIFNTNLYSWGLRPDFSKDFAKIEIQVSKTANTIEHFTITFRQTKLGANLIMAWDNVEAFLPINF